MTWLDSRGSSRRFWSFSLFDGTWTVSDSESGWFSSCVSLTVLSEGGWFWTVCSVFSDNSVLSG